MVHHVLCDPVQIDSRLRIQELERLLMMESAEDLFTFRRFVSSYNPKMREGIFPQLCTLRVVRKQRNPNTIQ